MLAAGAAGGSRIRPALVQSVLRMLAGEAPQPRHRTATAQRSARIGAAGTRVLFRGDPSTRGGRRSGRGRRRAGSVLRRRVCPQQHSAVGPSRGAAVRYCSGLRVVTASLGGGGVPGDVFGTHQFHLPHADPESSPLDRRGRASPTTSASSASGRSTCRRSCSRRPAPTTATTRRTRAGSTPRVVARRGGRRWLPPPEQAGLGGGGRHRSQPRRHRDAGGESRVVGRPAARSRSLGARVLVRRRLGSPDHRAGPGRRPRNQRWRTANCGLRAPVPARARHVVTREIRRTTCPVTSTTNWCTTPAGNRELNYRRFFAVTTLAGLRVEDERVFATTHERIRGLVRDGATGLRVDHPDGPGGSG